MQITIVHLDGYELNYANELAKKLRFYDHKVELVRAYNIKYFSLNPADLVISVGGDGTVLKTVSAMNDSMPVLGVNFGNVGFLADMEQAGSIDKICELVNQNNLKIDPRMMVDLYYNDKFIGTALNDITFKHDEDNNFIKYKVKVKNDIVTEFKGDGLIVSTPTGSSAYALSSGGPLVDPATSNFVLVPIAPFLLSSRPMVIDSNKTLEVNAQGGNVFLDGKKLGNVYPDEHDKFRCVKSRKTALFVDIGRTFFEKVNTKLKSL